jgi:hypothetical protein
MGTAASALGVAQSFIGYTEGPRNNETQFGAWSGYNFQPWCGSFVNWVLHHTNTFNEPSSVYTPSGAQSYQSLGRWIPRNGNPQPGDLVYFDWGGSQTTSRIDHIGFVEAVLPDGRIQTIEGNTSPNDGGSQGNGGGVYRRIRPRGVIAGFGRPRYDADNSSPYNPNSNVDWAALRRYIAAVLINELNGVGTLRIGSSGGQVLTLQKALNHATGSALAVDGRFGPATQQTLVSFQKFLGLSADGVFGPKSKAALQFVLEAIRQGK